MECLSPTHVPMIVQSGPGQDWTKQHILGEQLRLNRTKQPLPTPFIRNPALNMKSWSNRQNTGRRAVLHIPSSQPGARVGKAALKTPMKDTKSNKEWEDLLKKSLGNLQGLYAKMEAPPAPRSQVIGDRLSKPDQTGLDRTEMVSRALQAAVGSAPFTDESDSSGTEESYGSEDIPATPDTIRTNGDAVIDPRLFE